MTSGRPAFQQHVKRAEGSDTTPRLAHSESTAHRVKKQQHHQIAKRSRSPAGPRRLGTATRISASLSRRLFAFFGSTLDRDPKGAKFAVLSPGHAGFSKRVERSEGSDTTPTQNTPCFGVRAAVCNFSPKAECVSTFRCESERGAFVPEVLKTVWTMCWKRWYDCVSCALHGFFEDEKESRINGWRRNRRSARSLLPAVRAVDGGFSAVGCGVF